MSYLARQKRLGYVHAHFSVQPAFNPGDVFADFSDLAGQAANAFDVASCKGMLAIYSVRLQMIPKEGRSDPL